MSLESNWDRERKITKKMMNEVPKMEPLKKGDPIEDIAKDLARNERMANCLKELSSGRTFMGDKTWVSGKKKRKIPKLNARQTEYVRFRTKKINADGFPAEFVRMTKRELRNEEAALEYLYRAEEQARTDDNRMVLVWISKAIAELQKS